MPFDKVHYTLATRTTGSWAACPSRSMRLVAGTMKARGL